jgi:hypothetical protein
MDLRSWIIADIESLHDRLAKGFIGLMPATRWRERVDGGGLAPVSIAWHLARHHDVAVNAVVRGAPEVLDSWRADIGITRDTWRGLSESEDPELVDELDTEAVGRYLLAVLAASMAWLTTSALPDLAAVPDSARALAALGAPTDRFDWLYKLWRDKPVSFFLRWEAIGHGYNHLGELTSIRNRMGLRSF